MKLEMMTMTAGVALLIMTGAAMEGCQPPAKVIETEVTVVDGFDASSAGCTVSAAIEGPRVQIRASEGGRLASLTFVDGVLKLDPSDAATNEPRLEKRGDQWCAVGELDGFDCLEVVWEAGMCWSSTGQPTTGDD